MEATKATTTSASSFTSQGLRLIEFPSSRRLSITHLKMQMWASALSKRIFLPTRLVTLER